MKISTAIRILAILAMASIGMPSSAQGQESYSYYFCYTKSSGGSHYSDVFKTGLSEDAEFGDVLAKTRAWESDFKKFVQEKYSLPGYLFGDVACVHNTDPFGATRDSRFKFSIELDGAEAVLTGWMPEESKTGDKFGLCV